MCTSLGQGSKRDKWNYTGGCRLILLSTLSDQASDPWQQLELASELESDL